MPRPNKQVVHHGVGGRCVISLAVRSDSVGSSGHFKVLGTVGSIAFLRSLRRLSSNVFVFQVSTLNRFSLQQTTPTFVFLYSTLVLVTLATVFRMSSTGEELSKHSAEDSRGARAV